MRYRKEILLLILSITMTILSSCKVYDSATGQDVLEENEELLQQIEESETE